MVALRIEGVFIRLGEFDLRDISCTIEAGEYFCILGPTGAGKSVLIECIAGLQRPDRGSIFLGDQDVTPLTPEQRGIGYVPQDYALFPHMSVRRNIGFGLRVRHLPQDQIEKRVGQLAELFHIEHIMERAPLFLSGGEKQRVALARALAVRPQVLLLDEPLAAVDEQTRDRLCADLRDIQQRTGVTVIHISHNFEETLAVADRIGIMNAGRMIQVGTRHQIFSAPETRFIAEFTRSENIFPLAGAPTPLPDGRLSLPLETGDEILAAGSEALPGMPAFAVVRPEAVRITPLPECGSRGVRECGSRGVGDAPEGVMAATLARVTERGHLVRLEARTDAGTPFVSLDLRRDALVSGFQAGDRVHVCVPPEEVHLILSDDATGLRDPEG